MAPKVYPRVAHKTKACYVGMATSSSKANKRSATLERLLPLQNFALRWLTKGLLPWNGTFSSSKFYRQGGSQKRCARSGDKRSATVLQRMYDQISKSPLTRLASKVQTQGPEDQDEGPKEQRTKGPEDQGTKGPRDQRDQGTRGPRDQRDQGTRGPRDQDKGTKGPSDQGTSRPGPKE